VDCNTDSNCKAGYYCSANDCWPFLYVVGSAPSNNTVLNVSGSTSIRFNYTVIGSNASYNCSLYLNNSFNANNASTSNNTVSGVDSSTLSLGAYSWFVNCSANSTTNVSGTYFMRLAFLNRAPTVSSVRVNDSGGGAIQLSVADDMAVLCNATVTDPDGYSDIIASNATLYHQSGTSQSADDYNVHYTNSSCSFTGGAGNSRNSSCAFFLHHEALNGTWTCNVSSKDSAGNSGSATGANTVDQLVALTILEDSISFGSMRPGQNSSSANSTNITNMGNVMIDIQVAANAGMSCSGAGVIGAGNISYGVFPGSYDSMSVKKLSTGYVNESAFDLGVEGIETSEGVASTKKEYWTINIPQGVRGGCNNTVTVLAVIG